MRLRLSPQSNYPKQIDSPWAFAGFNEAAAFAAEQLIVERNAALVDAGASMRLRLSPQSNKTST